MAILSPTDSATITFHDATSLAVMNIAAIISVGIAAIGHEILLIAEEGEASNDLLVNMVSNYYRSMSEK